MAKRKRKEKTSNDLQNTIHKTKDRVTRASIKQGVNLERPTLMCTLHIKADIDIPIYNNMSCLYISLLQKYLNQGR